MYLKAFNRGDLQSLVGASATTQSTYTVCWEMLMFGKVELALSAESLRLVAEYSNVVQNSVQKITTDVPILDEQVAKKNYSLVMTFLADWAHCAIEERAKKPQEPPIVTSIQNKTYSITRNVKRRRDSGSDRSLVNPGIRAIKKHQKGFAFALSPPSSHSSSIEGGGEVVTSIVPEDPTLSLELPMTPE